MLFVDCEIYSHFALLFPTARSFTIKDEQAGRMVEYCNSHLPNNDLLTKLQGFRILNYVIAV